MSCFVFHLCARNKDIVDSASDTGSCVKEYGKSKFSKEVTRRINERKSEIGKIHDKRDTEAYITKIRYFYKEKGGDASARNFGIRKANGDYFVFLDADDLLMPKKLEIQARILDENPDIGLVYSDYYNMRNNRISHTVMLNRKLTSVNMENLYYSLLEPR